MLGVAKIELQQVALKVCSSLVERFARMQDSHVVYEDHITFTHGQRNSISGGHEMHCVDCFDLGGSWSGQSGVAFAC